MMSLALPGRGRHDEPEWTVLLTVAIALTLGLLLQGAVLGRTNTAETASGIVLSYPASWVRTSEAGALITAADLNRGGPFGARVSVREVPKADLQGVGDSPAGAATAWSLARGQNLVGYRVLGIEPGTANGREAANVEYAYLASAAQGADGMPALMRAIDTLVAGGDRYYILTFAAEAHEFASLTSQQFPRFRSVRDDVLRSWRLP